MNKKDLNLLIKDFKKVKNLERKTQENLEKDLEAENPETLDHLVKYLKKNEDTIQKLGKYDKEGVDKYTKDEKQNYPYLYYMIMDLVDNLECENFEKCSDIKKQIYEKY